jgi:4-amino-4-deoxy-L-arabinose transferase-like glycosyltransferase
MATQKIKNIQLVWWFSLGLLTLTVLLLLITPVLCLGLKFSINSNEGWNAYHALEVVSGELLYDKRNEWTPVNYPPVSFYIIGSIGRLLGEPLFAGRYISFLSLLLISLCVGYAVKKLGGKVYDAVFSGTFCIGLFAGFSQDYVGMNDPQMLGHIIILGGLLIYLQNSAKDRKIFIVEWH